MSNQCCSIQIFSLFFCLIASNVNVNAQHLTPQPQFRSSAISTGFVKTFNDGFSNARSISTGSFLKSNVQTDKHQGQELSTLDDGSKNKPTQPVISFVIPSYASGITHILDLNGKLPKIPDPSDALLPPIGLKPPINNDNEINSRALLPIEPQTLPNLISTTTVPSYFVPIAHNNNYNLPNVTPFSFSSKTNAEPTATPAALQPIDFNTKQSVFNFNNLFQPTISTIESTTLDIPRIFFTTNSSESQNSTEIPQQNLSSTDNLQETTSLSPEAWRRLLILGEQKTPGYAIRSDGSIDPNIVTPTATPVLFLETVATTSLPQTTFSDSNPFLPPLPIQSSVVNNRSNPFAAFKFTTSRFHKNTTSPPIVRYQPTNAPFFGQTTNSMSLFATKTPNPVLKGKPNLSMFIGLPPTVRSGFEFSKNIPVPDNNPLLPPAAPAVGNFTSKNQVNNQEDIQTTSTTPVNHLASTTEKAKSDSFPSTSNPFAAFKSNVVNILSATEITTATSNSVSTAKPTTSSLNRFPTNFASNISLPPAPKIQNEIEIFENISVPDNNPFLPPLVPVVGISVPNFAFNNQVNNQENIHNTTSSTFVNHLASTTEMFRIDSGTNQSIDNPTTTLTDRISNNDEKITTETSYPTLTEKSTIQPTSQSLFTSFEPKTESIAVKSPPNYPNKNLLPPLSSESSINLVENNTRNSSFELSNNPFLPSLDLNPFLAPFSSHLTQTIPQQISSIPSTDVPATTKPNTHINFTSKFDNSALRNNFFVKPSTQVKYFKYTGGFGAPPGILSPHNKKIH